MVRHRMSALISRQRMLAVKGRIMELGRRTPRCDICRHVCLEVSREFGMPVFAWRGEVRGKKTCISWFSARPMGKTPSRFSSDHGLEKAVPRMSLVGLEMMLERAREDSSGIVMCECLLVEEKEMGKD